MSQAGRALPLADFDGCLSGILPTVRRTFAPDLFVPGCRPAIEAMAIQVCTTLRFGLALDQSAAESAPQVQVSRFMCTDAERRTVPTRLENLAVRAMQPDWHVRRLGL